MAAHLAVILICLFMQVGLAIWAIISTGAARIKILKARELHYDQIALNTEAYPEHVQKLQNNLQNQFELPVLFYGVVALTAALNASNWAMAIAAIIYAGSRFVHRKVHVGSNHLPSRFKAFLVGLVAVSFMWLILGLELVLSF